MAETFLLCPHCQARYRIEPARLQALPAKVRCAKCGEVFDRPAGGDDARSRAFASGVAEPSRHKVLIVDDSKFFRNMLYDVLSPLFQVILQAGSAEEALPLLLRETPALLVLDLHLPGMNGVELLRLVRAHPETAGLKVLVLSSRARELEQLPALSADLVMNKSFTPDQLLAQVRRLLGGTT